MFSLPSEPNPWVTHRRADVYANPWVRVEHHDVTTPRGGAGIYGVVRFQNWACGVLPLDDSMCTWLVGQYRYPLDVYSWEMPEGGAPKGEDPLAGAQRELLEETGLVATDWTLLTTMHLSNSVTDETAFLYLARGLRHEAPMPDETEDLHVRRVPFADLLEWVLAGYITDAMTIAAVLRVELLRRDGLLGPIGQV